MTKPIKTEEAKPVLTAIFVREKSTQNILLKFPPSKAGEKRAKRYMGLADLEVIKQYTLGGIEYHESY